MHCDKDCDLWVRSQGSLTEKDQQFEGWMRAPMISPKKCFVVKVDGSEGEVDRERQQSLSRDVGDEMDTGENIIPSLQRPEDIQPSRVVVEHGTEDGVEMLGTSLGTGRSG